MNYTKLVRRFVRVRNFVRKNLINTMVTINYYLDKADKKGCSPIHLHINCNGKRIKISTKEKIKATDFDKES